MENAIELLLIEDNPDEALLTIRSLEKNKLSSRILHIDDGEEALDFIFAQNRYKDRSIEDGPAVILLDLKLPKVDGIEILKKVKADERTRVIPVIILTSSKQEKDIIECYHSGANSYVVKPVDFDVFSKVVGEIGTFWLLQNVPPIRKINKWIQ